MFKKGDKVTLELTRNDLSDIEADYLSERKSQGTIDRHFRAFEDKNTIWKIVSVDTNDDETLYEIHSSKVVPICMFSEDKLKLVS